MYNNIQLPNGKYIGDILRFLPNRKIIYKFLTGCGATHLELKCKRHSILIEPYIPVILGKKLKRIVDEFGRIKYVDDPDILIVYESIKEKHIIDYLSQKRKYYKIVSTPEGLTKIANACKELDIDMYSKFFLLVDECEKLIQDVDFRGGIVNVMQHFFKFRRRSFVSATPISPTDPRFSEHNFEDFFINPETPSLIPIDLYTTNNLASTIKNYFHHNRNDHYIIFINSTERIASVINFLKIHAESQVFCSQESVDKLKNSNKGEKNDKIENAQQHWDSKKFKKYNFFTSRFFTAFDMRLDSKPNVLMISDVVKVSHSALDPNTDVIQIIGRARNGVNHIAHISNWDASLQSKNEAEILSYLDGSYQAYRTIRGFKDTTTNPDAKKVFTEALEMVTFHKFIDPSTGMVSYFMKDNEVYANRIRGYYKRALYLVDAYNETNRFKLNHLPERYNLDDEKLEFLEQGLSQKEFLKNICELFEQHFEVQRKHPFNLTPNHTLYQLIRTHQILYNYYRVLGIDKIRLLEYNPVKIKREYAFAEIKNSSSYLKLQLSLLLHFKPNYIFSSSKIVRILSHLFKRYGIKLRPSIAQLKEWFDIRRTTVGYDVNGKEIKAHRILGSKAQIELPSKFRQ